MKQNKQLRIGVIGLAIVTVLNLVAVLALKQASSAFFSDRWWSGWFPVYLIALTFAIIGLAKRCRQKPDDTKADA